MQNCFWLLNSLNLYRYIMTKQPERVWDVEICFVEDLLSVWQKKKKLKCRIFDRDRQGMIKNQHFPRLQFGIKNSHLDFFDSKTSCHKFPTLRRKTRQLSWNFIHILHKSKSIWDYSAMWVVKSKRRIWFKESVTMYSYHAVDFPFVPPYIPTCWLLYKVNAKQRTGCERNNGQQIRNDFVIFARLIRSDGTTY